MRLPTVLTPLTRPGTEPEFEPMQSVLIRYPFGIPMTLIKEMAEDCKVMTIVASASQQQQVLNQYISAGVNTANCEWLIAPTDSYWTRDFGPWFVVKKDIPGNIIYVSNGYDPVSQHQHTIYLSDFLFINETPDRNYALPQPVYFKIRHQPEFNAGIMIRTGQGSYQIDSEKSIAGVAPGQFGVVYDVEKKICLGSGVIS